MGWIEVIEIRTTHNKLQLLEQGLGNIINGTEIRSKFQAFEVYRSGTVDTDFCIHLVHNSEINKCGSSLGIRFASALKDFGLVNHIVWEEMKNPKEI